MNRARLATLLLLAVLVPAVARAQSAPAPKPKTAASGPAAKAAGPRKLEDIHIEGQMPAPQVLFITARDQRRFLDFQHARYLRPAREIAGDARMPKRFVVPAHAAPTRTEER